MNLLFLHVNHVEDMINYKKLMHSLIFEKESLSQEQINQKNEKAYRLAKENFKIVGHPDFQEKIDSDLKQIAYVKPGRKLLKALVNATDSAKICVEPSGQNQVITESTIYRVGIKEEKSIFRTIQKNTKACTPSWISLAHELIHCLHFEYKPQFKYYSPFIDSNRKDILPGMDILEEQHTIIGFNHMIIIKSKLDVLCQNAFHIAIGQLPRADHSFPHLNDIDSRIWENKEELLDRFCQWIDKEVSLIRTVPYENLDDLGQILNFLENNPLALYSLPETLRNDQTFMINLFSVFPKWCAKQADKIFFKFFPELKEDINFLLKAIAKTPEIERLYKKWFHKLLNPSFLSDEKFVCNVLESLSEDWSMRREFIEILPESIRNSQLILHETKENILQNMDNGNIWSCLTISKKHLEDKELVLAILNKLVKCDHKDIYVLVKDFLSITQFRKDPDVNRILRGDRS